MPRPEGVGQVCEMEGCVRTAVCEVAAQWTIVDFVSYQSCEEHAEDMCSALDRRTVDGAFPVEIWVLWWDATKWR